jgi:hypothetical protein
MTHRSVVFLNNSGRGGTVCLFQTDPGLAVDGVKSLAWLTKEVNPTTRVIFRWALDYVFVWYDSGKLAPGVVCVASQVRPAHLTGYNQVDFTRNHHGFLFEEDAEGHQELGNLYILQDETIPLDRVAVGIGMAGQGALVVQAQPNMTYKFVSPNPQYWITFGSFRTGEILEVGALPTPVARIDFPDNVDSMTAVLDTEERWTVRPTHEVFCPHGGDQAAGSAA